MYLGIVCRLDVLHSVGVTTPMAEAVHVGLRVKTSVVLVVLAVAVLGPVYVRMAHAHVQVELARDVPVIFHARIRAR